MSQPGFLLSVSVTQAQFDSLKNALSVQKDVVVACDPSGYPVSFCEKGTITTSDADLSFGYSAGVISIALIKPISFLARHAPNSTVAGHVHDLIIKALHPSTSQQS